MTAHLLIYWSFEPAIRQSINQSNSFKVVQVIQITSGSANGNKCNRELCRIMSGRVGGRLGTRKRGKAQRVARRACAKATVHFLLTHRLAMLLPSNEWPLKTSAQRILAYMPSPPMKMRHKLSGVKCVRVIVVCRCLITK